MESNEASAEFAATRIGRGLFAFYAGEMLATEARRHRAMCGEINRRPRVIYLVKRGPRPEYHRAPFHPVIMVVRRDIAKREAGSTSDRATVWVQESSGSGMLISRWEGLDIDYGPVVHGVPLPDGTVRAFAHRHEKEESHREPWRLATQAVWWSSRKIPDWVARDYGVKPPEDQFSLDRIRSEEYECSFGRKRR